MRLRFTEQFPHLNSTTMSGSDLVTEVIGGSLGEEDLALYRQIKISVIGRKLGRTISIRSEDCLDCESSSADWRYRIEPRTGGANMTHLLRKLCWHDEGQDIAEYAVMKIRLQPR